MFGLGWAEIMVAAIVGLIVIGPKELPVVFRKIGQFVGKAKGMARDFSRAMNDAADDSGMKDAMDSVNSLQDGVRSVTDPTTKWKDFVPGSETAQLAEERAEKSKKMHDAMAVKSQGRLNAEKVINVAAKSSTAPKGVGKLQSKKPAPKKSVVAKVPGKSIVERKPSASPKKVVIKKNVANKTAPKPGKTT